MLDHLVVTIGALPFGRAQFTNDGYSGLHIRRITGGTRHIRGGRQQGLLLMILGLLMDVNVIDFDTYKEFRLRRRGQRPICGCSSIEALIYTSFSVNPLVGGVGHIILQEVRVGRFCGVNSVILTIGPADFSSILRRIRGSNVLDGG